MLCGSLMELVCSVSTIVCYENYEKFSISKYCDDECKNNFRFYREDIYQLLEVLQLPPELMCYNGMKLDSVEAFSIFFYVALQIWFQHLEDRTHPSVVRDKK